MNPRRIAPLLALVANTLYAAETGLPGNLPPGPAPTGNSAFGVTTPVGKALQDKPGFISWPLLTLVEAVPKGDTFVPRFDKRIQNLNGKPVKLQGFMLPLTMGDKQSHFVLAATPPSCAFCLPGGPDQVIEVKASNPIRYRHDVVELSGKFEVLQRDPMGLYYRLTDAKSIE